MNGYIFLRPFRFLFLLTLLSVQLKSFGQDVKLQTQAQVDAFDPETTVINGNLQIGTTLMPSSGFTSDITDISNLSNLTTVKGYLHLIDAGLLESLDALGNITSIDYHLEIRECSTLTDVDGLSGITKVRGDLRIEDNRNLLNLDGLSNITSVGRSLWIDENENLIDITGLSGITSVGSEPYYKSIYVRDNENLVNLDGLNNITKIYWLEIKSNESLTDINGLDGLIKATGFKIYENHSLINVDGLINLTNVQYMRIEKNAELMNVDGLGNITTIDGYLLIEENGKLTNLDGLRAVSSIQSDLSIISNKNLTNLDGLIGLTELLGELNIVSNEKITNLDGLSNVTGQIESLNISANDNLIDLNGLSGITDVEKDIEIIVNQNLKNCCGIKGLLENFSTDGTVTISGNPSECSSEQEVLGAICGLTIITDTNPPCIGVENGGIEVNVKGYDAIPFNYTWLKQEDNLTGSGISISDQFTIPMLGSGTYNLTVTNSEPDTAVKTDIVLSQKEGYIFEITQLKTTNSSNGQNNGSITISTSGGIAPYKYTWTGVDQGNFSGVMDNIYTIPSLHYGEYSITVEDNVGASKTIEVTLLDDSVPVIECMAPLDIVILNDVSSSVDAIEYSESKHFFVDFLRAVNIGPGDEESRAAIVEWSSEKLQKLKIPITGNPSTLDSYLYDIRFFDGGTFPHEAMKFGESYLTTVGRNGVEKVLILSTDGGEGQISSSLIALANEFKAKGFHIITIAFDGAYSSPSTRDLLRKVASVDELAPGAPAYSLLDADLAENIVSNYLCPIDPGSSATAHFDRDGAINITSIELQNNCPNPGFVDVTIYVTSREELSLPAGTPISFYHNNPNQFGSTPILTWQIPCVVPVGSTEVYTITLPMDTPSHIFAVLNDDGLSGPPISFPITAIEELDYDNNIDSRRVCLDGQAALQALKYSTSNTPACDTLLQLHQMHQFRLRYKH
ncbi:MAG: VWA domain-containing protein [Bacteroidota bacterium]